MKTRIVSGIYLVLIYGFIFLPVAVLVLFSFQDGRLPVPPLKGLTLKWYGQILDHGRQCPADRSLRPCRC